MYVFVLIVLGPSLLNFGPQFHIYIRMHTSAGLVALHYTDEVRDITAEHCGPISHGQR